MKKLYSFFAATLALATLICSNAGAFEISAYYDPISVVQLETQCCLDTCPKPEWVNGISFLDNADVLHWYQEMGITNLCVHYRPSDFNDYLAFAFPASEERESLGVMNERWPGRMYQYLEAQGAGRKTRVAYPSDPFLDPTTCTGSYGCNVRDTLRYVSDQVGTQHAMYIGPGDGTAQEFWRPKVAFGSWKGWSRHQVPEWIPNDTASNRVLGYVMPIRVRLVCDLDPPPDSGDTHVVAVLRWMRNAVEFETSDADTQVLYPAVRITADMFSPTATAFDTLVLYVDPVDYTWARGARSTPADTQIYVIPDAYDLTPVDSFGYPWDNYYQVFSQRFSITFCDSGGHTFYLYSVEAMDDAYWRMFEAPYDTIHATETMIADSFAADFRRWPYPHMRGWYYDEIYDDYAPFLRSWLRVNQILRGSGYGLPTFFFNGFAFDDNRQNLQMDSMYYLFNDGFEGSEPSTFMLETYYFWGETDSVSFSWYYPPFFFTRYDSDEPYLDSTYVGDATWPEGQSRQYNGTQSLQRAIDWTYWRVPDTTACRVLHHEDQCLNITGMEFYPGFIDQVQMQHDPGRGGKLWALLQAGRGKGDSSLDQWRDPSPQEIKLEAWMAVASDADGIMYYWGMPTGPGPYPGSAGLFDWEGSGFCQGQSMHAVRNERYYAAKTVDEEILRVTPILEPLKFVKSFSSRAFERNYPDSTHAATALDTLTDRHWCGDHVRAVKAIRSYEPCSYGDTACFISSPESYPYVQVSRFRNRHVPYLDPDVEDYWFLVVNRRALSDEWRKIELDIPVIYDGPYYVLYVLGDSTKLQPISTNRETDCHLQTITLVLPPGEAQLIHFTRGENGCQDASARVDSLTAILEGEDGIRLNWEEPTQSVDSLPFTPQTYYILRRAQSCNGRYDTIAFTETNTFLDTLALAVPKAFYMVHACGTITERPGGALIEAPEEPKKVKLATGTALSKSR
jgi:hypothetical protein